MADSSDDEDAKGSDASKHASKRDEAGASDESELGDDDDATSSSDEDSRHKRPAARRVVVQPEWKAAIVAALYENRASSQLCFKHRGGELSLVSLSVTTLPPRIPPPLHPACRLQLQEASRR